MELITMGLVAAFLGLLYILRRDSNADDGVNLPPGSMGLPFIGETLKFAVKKVAYFSEQHEKYGRVFKTSLFGKRIVRVYGVDNIRRIIQGENKTVQSSYPTTVRRLIGDQSISMSTGEQHKDRKRLLMTYLSPAFFHDHTPVLDRTIAARLQDWSSNPSVDLFPACRRLFTELSARFLINIDIPDEHVNELIDQLKIFSDNIFCLPVNLPGFAFHKALNAKQRMREIIASALVTSENNNDTAATLSSVLQGLSKSSTAPNDITTDDSKNIVLIDAIIDLLFSGVEPVSSAGFSLAYHLTKHADVLNKLRAEINATGLNDPNVPVGSNDLPEMKYLDAVVKETLRMMPPVGGAFRTALESFELDGYTIPKGWSVAFGIRETHKQDASVDGTSVFNPERWLYSDPAVSEKHAYLPFGGGSRACPGQAYARMVLKLFAIELARASNPELIEDSEYCYWPTPRPVNRVLVSLK